MSDPESRPSEAWDQLLAAGDAILAGSASDAPDLEGARLVGIGWATVDIERAQAELGAAISDDGSWVEAPRDALLGARSAVSRPGVPGGPVAVVLEPDTEGRLAAFLARHGEGIGAVYVTIRPVSRLAPGAFGIPAGGPLGRGRHYTGGRPGEPTIVVLDSDPSPP